MRFNRGLFVLTGLLVIIISSTSFARAKAKSKIQPLKPDQIVSIAESYGALVFKTYDTLLGSNQALLTEVRALAAAPTEAQLEKTKEAWKAARLVYSLTESFRFYGGPIDRADGEAAERGPEPLINAWPIDEAYLDGVRGNENSGLVQDANKELNEKNLVDWNEKDGERNISTGYHAIEFLLWGQDFSVTGPGSRSIKDFQPDQNQFAQRRSQVLVLLTELLVKHSGQLKAAWAPEAKYPRQFKAEKPDEILRRILVGVTTLGSDEMAGERLTVALEKNDPEHEQDCFSDFSIEDLKANQQGIEAVLVQSGLLDFFKKQKPKEAKLLVAQLAHVKRDLNAIPAPFDALLIDKKNPNRKKVESAILSLQKQSRIIDRITKTWGLELNVQSE